MELHSQPCTMLASEEKDRLRNASCALLEEVGVKVGNRRVIDLLTQEGAVYENGRLRVPRAMVEGALATTPKTIRFGAPDPDRAFTVDGAGREVRFGTGGQALYVLHRRDGAYHRDPAGSADLEEIISLCDRLEHVDFITRPVECDVPAEEMDLRKARIFADNTSKPMNLANLVDPAKLPEIIETLGDASYLSFIVCLVASPLAVDDSAADKLFAIVERGLPVSLSSCPQAGTTAPLSEVGELIQLNAELLFGLTLVQAIREGAPALYRGIPITADLTTDGAPRWCQPESTRRLALAAELCRHMGVPCCGTAGVSDEREPTAQGVAEKAVSLTYEAAAGAQYINSAFGMLEQVMTVAPDQYVIDDMIVGLVKRELGDSYAGSRREEGIHAAAAARSVALKALERLGVSVDDAVKDELDARLAFIEEGKEGYGEEEIQRQADALRAAVESPATGSYFMKKARKGLRAGYLYQGARIEGTLDLSRLQL